MKQIPTPARFALFLVLSLLLIYEIGRIQRWAFEATASANSMMLLISLGIGGILFVIAATFVFGYMAIFVRKLNPYGDTGSSVLKASAVMLLVYWYKSADARFLEVGINIGHEMYFLPFNGTFLILCYMTYKLCSILSEADRSHYVGDYNRRVIVLD